jgi:hypothetical protein
MVTALPATVTEPERAAPLLLAVAETFTVPAPDLPLPTVIQDEPELVVQLQPAAVVTLMLPDVEFPPKLIEPGDTVNEQGGCAAWVMVTGWPAIVTVPVRAAPLLAVTEIVAVPDPETPAVTEIQDALEDVVQPQPVWVVTLTLDEAAADAKLTPLADTVYVHGCGTGVGCVPPVAATKLATVATLLFSARALSCEAIPVAVPLNATRGLEK